MLMSIYLHRDTAAITERYRSAGYRVNFQDLFLFVCILGARTCVEENFG